MVERPAGRRVFLRSTEGSAVKPRRDTTAWEHRAGRRRDHHTERATATLFAGDSDDVPDSSVCVTRAFEHPGKEKGCGYELAGGDSDA